MFFATLRFEVKGLDHNPEPMHFLNKSDAQKVRNLILGICTTKRKNIHLKKISNKDKALKKTLQKIGKVKYSDDS